MNLPESLFFRKDQKSLFEWETWETAYEIIHLLR